MLALEQKNNLGANKTFAGDAQGLGDLYANLIDVSFDGFIVCEYPSGKIVHINCKGCGLLGFDKEEILGKSFWNLFRQFDAFVARKRLEAKWNGRIRSDSSKSYMMLKKDGSSFHASIIGELKKVSGQQFLFGTFRDKSSEDIITEHLRQAQKNETFNMVARSLVHDLNNTLFPIMSNAEMAKTDLAGGNTVKIQARMDKILHASLHAKDLLQKVLLFGKSRPSATVGVSPLQTVVKEMVYLLKSTMQSSLIQVNEKFPSEIIMVLGEAVRIRQVVQNLCMNAIQAMVNTKGGILEVEVKSEEVVGDERLSDGNYAMIIIKDTGCGISPANLKRIFRDNYTTKKNSLHGIGLSVVQSIVGSLKGKITVASQEGKGSTFCVYLPVALDSELQINTKLRLVN